MHLTLCVSVDMDGFLYVSIHCHFACAKRRKDVGVCVCVLFIENNGGSHLNIKFPELNFVLNANGFELSTNVEVPSS